MLINLLYSVAPTLPIRKHLTKGMRWGTLSSTESPQWTIIWCSEFCAPCISPKSASSSVPSQWSLVFNSLLHEYGIAYERPVSHLFTLQTLFKYCKLLFADPRCQSEDMCNGVTPTTQAQTTAKTKNTSSRSRVNYTLPNTPTKGMKHPGNMRRSQLVLLS